MLAYSITPVPCNDIRLRSGRVVEPLIIEDIPSFVHEERMNQQYLSNTMTPIIEDTEHPTNMLAETQEDTFIDTQITQLIREPPYPEILILPKVVGQPQFNILGELKSIFMLKFHSFGPFKTYLSMPEPFRICV